MKNIFKKTNDWFYIAPILSTLIFSIIVSFCLVVIVSLIRMITYSSSFYYQDILPGSLVYFFFIFPIILTIENIVLIFIKPQIQEKENAIKRWEAVAIFIGSVFSFFYMSITQIKFKDWNVTLYNSELHTPISTKAFLTIGIITLIAISGYIILRFVSLDKLPPLFAVICISSLYLGILQCILWCIQIYNLTDMNMILLCLFPLNCIFISIRTIKSVVNDQIRQTENVSYKYKKISILLNNTSNWPWLAFIVAIPLLGIIVAILLVFGQEPDSLIKGWTETADWNMSKKVAPQNIYVDEHYLCTVAAGGHKSIVKPIRIGKRHGHRVIVNRQLCIANAFEQLLEERTPNFHSFVRALYDEIGYPIAKHIKSPYIADIIYFIMKPPEWIFLICLYLFDRKPENRIAVQYPHSTPPTLN